MKKILLNLVFLTFHIVLTSQVDRSIPNPEPAPQINFEDPISFIECTSHIFHVEFLYPPRFGDTL